MYLRKECQSVSVEDKSGVGESANRSLANAPLHRRSQSLRSLSRYLGTYLSLVVYM